jgi:hypothetical protein
MTVGEMLSRMSAHEITEWQVWAALRGGLSAERAERNAALVCAITANVHRKPGRPPFTVKDFLPRDPTPDGQPERMPMLTLTTFLGHIARR